MTGAGGRPSAGPPEVEDWRPACPVSAIAARATLYRDIRRFFDDRGFLEADPPVLSRDTVVDRYLEPIPVPVEGITVRSPDGDRPEAYLQTSPEFALKRLVAAGVPALYSLSHAFRAGEVGAHHNVEFTMLEWYRVGDDLAAGVDLLADLTAHLLPGGRPDAVTYDEAFRTHLGVSGLTATGEEYRQLAYARGLPFPDSLGQDVDDWRNLLMGDQIQPALGLECPVIVTHYPASQAALARLSDDHPGTAERFELFFRGVELANGYHELLDADALRHRARVTNDLRRSDGHPALPVESRLLDAMRAGLPACSGCAMGVDRVLMLRTGAASLKDVVAFPWDRA